MKRYNSIWILSLVFVLLCTGCSGGWISTKVDGDGENVDQSKLAIQSMQSDGKEKESKPAAGKNPTTAKTTKAGTTAREETTTKKSSGSIAPTKALTNEADRIPSRTTPSTTKPGQPQAVTPGSGSVATTKPSTTTPSTTKPTGTTKPPVAKGDSLAIRVTYLNEVTDKTPAKLTDAEFSGLGVSEALKKKVRENPDDYALYTIQLEFTNAEDVPVTVYRVEAANNGQGDVYINGKLSTTLGVASGKKMSERFLVLAKSSDADGFVLKKLNDLSLRVQYAATLSDDTATPSYVYATAGK